MKGLSKETLIKILEMNNYDFYLKSDMDTIFEAFGDDYYIDRDTGQWALCKKNERVHGL